MNLPDSTPQQPKLRARTKKCEKLKMPLFGHDGEEIPPWNEVIYCNDFLDKRLVKFLQTLHICIIIFQDLNRAKGAPKDRVLVPEDILDFLIVENQKQKRGKKEEKKEFYFPWAESVLVTNIFWERLLGFREGRDGWLSCTVCKFGQFATQL